MPKLSTRPHVRKSSLSSALLLAMILSIPRALAVPVQTSTATSTSSSPTSTLSENPNQVNPAESASPTVLAFQMVESAVQSSVVYNNALPTSSSPAAAADPSPMFYLGYDNAWDSTIDTLQSSLPNITTSSSNGSTDISAQAFQQIPQAARNGHSTLTYRLYFPLDFDFSKDARLPSIYSGRLGCANTRVRYTPEGLGELYLYNPTQSQSDALCATPPLSTCDGTGMHLGRGAWTFPKERWMTIRHELWLNSPGLSDGGFNIWLDGQLVLSSHGVRYGDRPTQCLSQAGLAIRPPPNELFDGCLPPSRARWVYGPAIRRKIYRPIPTPKVVTRIMTQTAVPPAVTITQNIPVTVTQATTETQVNQVTIPTTIQVTATETATATTIFTEIPEPTDPPVDDVPVEDPPEEEPPADDPPADEEAILVAAAKAGHQTSTPTPAPVAKRDNGLWKGLNGYPGDVGYNGAASAAPGYPFTFTFLQVVTLPGPVATVTVTKPLPKPKPKPAKKKP